MPDILTRLFGSDSETALSGYKASYTGQKEEEAGTQEEKEEVIEQAYTEGNTGAVEASNLQSDEGVDMNTVLDRVEKLEGRLSAKDQHISRIESENKAYREVLEKFSTLTGGEPDEDPDPLEDPVTLDKFREASEKDPVGAMALMLKKQREDLRREFSEQTKPMQEARQQEVFMRELQQRLESGKAMAIERLGEPAREIVSEFERFTSGQGNHSDLADLLNRNRNVVLSAEGVASAIAYLALAKGSISNTNPEASPTPQSRPKASQSVPSQPQEVTEEDHTRAIARAIVEAESPSGSLPFVRNLK